jgi:uncharacterized membrane protein YkoI
MLLKRTLIMTTAGVLVLAAAMPAFAESEHEGRDADGDMVMAASAAVTLAQAISAAEGATGGRAVQAEYESVDGTAVVAVRLVKEQAVVLARVDATSGAVTPVAPGKNEEEEDDDDSEEG